MSDAGLLRVEGIRSHFMHVYTQRAEPRIQGEGRNVHMTRHVTTDPSTSTGDRRDN